MSGTETHREALERLSRAAECAGLSYAVIGGIAVILRGHDRTTVDLDAVMLDLDERLDKFIAALQDNGLSFRVPNGREFARRHRVLLLVSANQTQVDLSMGFLPFEVETVQRSSLLDLGNGLRVPVASVEDLIIMKLVAGRPRDFQDIEALKELYPDLDRKRIRTVVTDYAELLENPEMIKELDARI